MQDDWTMHSTPNLNYDVNPHSLVDFGGHGHGFNPQFPETSEQDQFSTFSLPDETQASFPQYEHSLGVCLLRIHVIKKAKLIYDYSITLST